MITIQETWTGPRDFALTGKYFRLLACANPVDVFLFGGGSPDDVALQVPAGFYTRQSFDRVRVVTAAGGDTVKFVVSDDESGIDTFTFSQLQTNASLAQGGDFDSSNGNAWTLRLLNGGVAAQVSDCGIANLAASLKTQYVDRITLGSNLATGIVAETGPDTDFPAVTTGQKKNVAGLAAVKGTSTSNVVISGGLMTFSLEAGRDRDIVFARPFRLLPGNSLKFQTVVVNCVLSGFAEGREY